MKRKILLLDDKENLRNSIAANIDSYDVIPTGGLEDAIGIVKAQIISFIAVDWDLGNDETGDLLSELIYQAGKAIPAIVFSGNDLSQGTQDYLKSKGFSKIISKIDPDEDSVSDLIEKAANEILSDCKARTFDVKQRVLHVGNGDQPIKFNKFVKTIDEWIKEMEECMHEQNELELRELIIKNCHAFRKRLDDYVFEH